jgi:hypothetical protein
VLWRNVNNGQASLWRLNSDLFFEFNQIYGGYDGWIAESLSIDTNGNSFPRLIWRHTGGYISIWILDQDWNYVTSRVYGPYFGYDPASPSAANDKEAASASAANDKAAADAMNR